MNEAATTSSWNGTENWHGFIEGIRSKFAQSTASERIYTTTATGLFATFLGAMPAEARQHYTCTACRHFIERFGGLVVIGADGRAHSALWSRDEADPFFAPVVNSLRRAVERSAATGVFFSDDPTWGMPQNRDKARGCVWHHLAVPGLAQCKPPARITAAQASAAKVEEFGMLHRGVGEFGIDVVRQALALLTNGTLYRADKHRAMAEWLFALHESIQGIDHNRRVNMLWQAVAGAPAGWCHVRSGMLGTLLEDIAAGMSVDEVKRRFAEKMDPLQYLRPQAPPSAGNIAAAEKLVEQMGIAPSLRRRFARIEDCTLLWSPRAADVPKTSGGVFGHLTPKGASNHPGVPLPSVTMTWAKFRAEVLPTADRVEFSVPSHGHFTALVTAAVPDAPPIVQWDREDARNPVTWYVYSGGSSASAWGMSAGAWAAVAGIALSPHQWADEGAFSHHGKRAFILLDGARDVAKQRGAAGGGMFPELLRAELHPIRSTVEAYTRRAVIEGADDATACGYMFNAGDRIGCSLRVTSKLGVGVYLIDRWD